MFFSKSVMFSLLTCIGNAEAGTEGWYHFWRGHADVGLFTSSQAIMKLTMTLSFVTLSQGSKVRVLLHSVHYGLQDTEILGNSTHY
jgi:hypothetical protein